MSSQFKDARTCYDHLAGHVGVRLMQALLDSGALVASGDVDEDSPSCGGSGSDRHSERDYVLGPNAAAVFARLGVAPAELVERSSSRRPLLRSCLDCSERRHHLAGRLGALVLSAMLDAGWITRIAGCRAVLVTDAGARELHARLAAIDL